MSMLRQASVMPDAKIRRDWGKPDSRVLSESWLEPIEVFPAYADGSEGAGVLQSRRQKA
jgi:hypothetical protein